MSNKQPIHLETRTASGEKKFSPTAANNRAPISKVLLPLLPQNARVLEIASGTGEHALHMCQSRADIIWQTSDPDAESRMSQNAWAKEVAGQMKPSLDIDTTQDDWTCGLAKFDVIYCANMIHIAPWAAAEGLAKGAQDILKKDQICVLYGPFKEGDKTAPSNLDFDASLKSRNPAWGVRDLEAVKHIFELHGFNLIQQTAMPKNNQILVFKRA